MLRGLLYGSAWSDRCAAGMEAFSPYAGVIAVAWLCATVVHRCGRLADGGGRMARFRMLILAVGAVLLAASCSEKFEPAADGTMSPLPATDAAGALARAQAAVDGAGGYHVEMAGHNFVLPQWGGVESVAIDVGKQGTTASARIVRTGDGVYGVVLVDGQTFFKRETCSTWTRVPGGGPAVLEPFLWNRTGPLRRGTEAVIEANTGETLVVRATFPGIGEASIEVESKSGRPLRLVRPAGTAGEQLTWTFSEWGKAPAVTKPSGNIPDRGPGGNPC